MDFAWLCIGKVSMAGSYMLIDMRTQLSWICLLSPVPLGDLLRSSKVDVLLDFDDPFGVTLFPENTLIPLWFQIIYRSLLCRIPHRISLMPSTQYLTCTRQIPTRRRRLPFARPSATFHNNPLPGLRREPRTELLVVVFIPWVLYVSTGQERTP